MTANDSPEMLPPEDSPWVRAIEHVVKKALSKNLRWWKIGMVVVAALGALSLSTTGWLVHLHFLHNRTVSVLQAQSAELKTQAAELKQQVAQQKADSITTCEAGNAFRAADLHKWTVIIDAVEKLDSQLTPTFSNYLSTVVVPSDTMRDCLALYNTVTVMPPPAK